MKPLSLLLLTFALAARSATASEAPIPSPEAVTEQLLESIAVTIDGRETPHLVPFSHKMGHFLSVYEMNPGLIGDALQPAERGVLSKAKAERELFMEMHVPWLDAQYVAIVASHASTSASIELAARLDELEQLNIERMDSFYERLLKKMSRHGEQIVRSYIARHVHPNFSTVTNTALATKAPDYFLADVRSRYAEIRAGQSQSSAQAMPTQAQAARGARVGVSSRLTLQLQD